MNKNRPHIICLMMSSVDGKILGDTWGENEEVKKLVEKFEEIHEAIGVKAWIVGRHTMEKDFTHFEKPILESGNDTISREDHIVRSDFSSYAIAIDANGKLGWKAGTVLGDHVITVLTESVQDDYLRHLRTAGVSYIFAGKDSIDLALAVGKLNTKFNIQTLMLEGGGKLNGSFLQQGLLDEFHQLLLPIIDGKANTSTIFEIDNNERQGTSTLLKLENIQQIEDDVLWIKYSVRK